MHGAASGNAHTVDRMSGFSRLARAATGFLRTPKGKQVGGRVLGGAAQAADRATGQKYTDRITKARLAAERGLKRF